MMLGYIHMQTGQRGVGVITPSNVFDKYTEFLRAGSTGDYIRANGLDRLPWVKRTMEHPAYDAYWQGQDLARMLAARPSTGADAVDAGPVGSGRHVGRESRAGARSRPRATKRTTGWCSARGITSRAPRLRRRSDR